MGGPCQVEPKVSVPSFIKRVTKYLVLSAMVGSTLTTARSRARSRLKSAAIIPMGAVGPAGTLVGVLKFRLPADVEVLRKTLTVPLSALATAMSGLPSPLKSPATIDLVLL